MSDLGLQLPDGPYPYSVFTTPADTEWDGPFCSITGERAVDGACPTHGGDNCLVMHPVEVESVTLNVADDPI